MPFCGSFGKSFSWTHAFFLLLKDKKKANSIIIDRNAAWYKYIFVAFGIN
jgi:hypothetical protein